MMQIARNKDGRLVIGKRLRRKKRYAQKRVCSYNIGGCIEEVMGDDHRKPLDQIEWEGVYGIVRDESVFDLKIRCLTWNDEPIKI